MLRKRLKGMWTDPVWSKVIAAIIFALLVSVATYLTGFWPPILRLLSSIPSINVPLWPFLVGLPVVVLTAFLAGRRNWRPRGWARGVQQEISFHYLPESPTLHGWKFTEKPPYPKFTTLEDGFLGKTLLIEPENGYGLDYLLQAVSKVSRVTVIGKWTSDSPVYLRIRLVSSSGQSEATGWIQLRSAITAPKEIGKPLEDWYEWLWPVNLRLQNGWQLCVIDVEQAVEQTFGLNGWKYAHLEGYRVRGKIHLARIRWENPL